MEEFLLHLKKTQHNIGFPIFKLPENTKTILKLNR